MGEHADFQVILELGPQKETRPIGDQEDSSKDENNFRKRYIAKQEELQLQRELAKAASENGNWLEKWYYQVQAYKSPETKDYEKDAQREQVAMEPKLNLKSPLKPSYDKSHMKVPEKPKIPKDIVKHLQRLYQLAGSNVGTVEEAVDRDNTPQVNYFIKDEYSGPYQSINLSLSSNEEEAQLQKAEALSEAKAKRKISEELMDVRLDK